MKLGEFAYSQRLANRDEVVSFKAWVLTREPKPEPREPEEWAVLLETYRALKAKGEA